MRKSLLFFFMGKDGEDRTRVLTVHNLVEWPRYKEKDARFVAGLEDSFSSFG